MGGVLHKQTVLKYTCILILEKERLTVISAVNGGTSWIWIQPRPWILWAAARRSSNVHSEEKPHLCTLCGKSFSQLNVLKLHQKRHIDVKNHVCFKCEMTFITDAEMKQLLNW